MSRSRWPAAALEGSADRAAFHGETDAAEALYALRSGRPVVDFRTRLRCKDGSYKRCQWRSMPAIEEGMIYSVGRPLEGSASDPVELGEAPPKRTLTVARH